MARILALPGETEVAELMAPADPDAIHVVARFCRTTIARALRPVFESLVSALPVLPPCSVFFLLVSK